jgi:hypothetical protein
MALFPVVGLVPSFICILSAISLWYGEGTSCNRIVGGYFELPVAGFFISSAVLCPLIIKKNLTHWRTLLGGEKALAFILASISALAVAGSCILFVLVGLLEALCE